MNNWRELLLGPSYFYHKKLINNSYGWDEREIGSYLLSKRERICGEPRIITKRELQSKRNNNSIIQKLLTKNVTTGGTTGTPFEFKQDYLFTRQKERAYIFDIWSTVDYKPFDLRVIIRGNISEDLIQYNRFENAFVISPNKLLAANKSKVFDFLSSLKPFFLHVYPSSLLRFIDYIGKSNFEKLAVLGIMAGSEVFPKGQMEWVIDSFNVKIAHWYGHSEYAVLAKYCHSCNGFHFYPTYGLAEFVKDQKSGLSKIIATSYNHIGTKFVRYDTEDLAIINSKKCDKCVFPRVESIVGREQEYFIDKFGQTQAFGPFLFGIHGEFWTKIQDIQFMQASLGKMEAFIVCSGNKSRIWIEKYISRRFALVDLSFHYVDRIEKTNHMKHKYYINNIVSSE